MFRKSVHCLSAYTIQTNTELKNFVIVFCTGVDDGNTLYHLAQRDSSSVITYVDYSIFDENIYTLSENRKRELGIKALPRDLAEAADALESDNEFLKPVFDGDLLETILEFARDAHFDVTSRTHPHEFQLYFDV